MNTQLLLPSVEILLHLHLMETAIHVFIADSRILTTRKCQEFCNEPRLAPVRLHALLRCKPYWQRARLHAAQPAHPSLQQNGTLELCTCFDLIASCKRCLYRLARLWPPPLAPPLGPDLPTTETTSLLACSSCQLGCRELNQQWRKHQTISQTCSCMWNHDFLAVHRGLVVEKKCCWHKQHIVSLLIALGGPQHWGVGSH